LRKAILLGVLTLAILAVGVAPTYAYLSRYLYSRATSSATPRTTSWTTSGAYPQETEGRCWRMNGLRGFNSLRIEVSEEFKQRVIDIASSDPDVQDLLNDGYEVTSVKPIIKAVVQGNGDVTIKATGATVTLTKENVGFALVEVDLETEAVTRITIMSRTVIEKSP